MGAYDVGGWVHMMWVVGGGGWVVGEGVGAYDVGGGWGVGAYDVGGV